MNKVELIGVVAENSGVAKCNVEKVLDAFTETVMDTVARDEKVQLVGFGGFYRARRAAKRGVNPRTGEQISIPERHTPKFKASTAFREKCNE